MSSTETEKVQNLESDIVIIGGGGGGLPAAVAAAENGVKRVKILEAAGRLGGKASQATGMFACESPTQKRVKVDCRADDCFKIAMNWAHWRRVNARVVRAYINKSGDTIRWLEEKGLECEATNFWVGQKHRAFHRQNTPGGFGSGLVKVLSKSCGELGFQVLYHTRGKRILQGTKGNVTGVVAVNKKGEEFQIKADSVIIATGGAGNDIEFMKKHCPDYREGRRISGWPHHTGDGFVMAAEAGAAIADSIPIGREGPRPDFTRGLASGSVRSTTLEPTTVWVNKRGERIGDESAAMGGWGTADILDHQPGRLVYSLFDDQIKQDIQYMLDKGFRRFRENVAHHSSGDQFDEDLKKEASQPEDAVVKISDSWTEIANWIGAPPDILEATIEEYNSFCDKGQDDLFAKDREYLQPLRKAPYYAIRCASSGGNTLGGIITTEHMEVMDTHYKVIPGLYAAGVLPDGFVGYTYCAELCGTALGFSVNSGRIAGESAAKFVLEK